MTHPLLSTPSQNHSCNNLARHINLQNLLKFYKPYFCIDMYQISSFLSATYSAQRLDHVYARTCTFAGMPRLTNHTHKWKPTAHAHNETIDGSYSPSVQFYSRGGLLVHVLCKMHYVQIHSRTCNSMRSTQQKDCQNQRHTFKNQSLIE